MDAYRDSSVSRKLQNDRDTSHSLSMTNKRDVYPFGNAIWARTLFVLVATTLASSKPSHNPQGFCPHLQI
ncbi:hypothetical protein CQA66_05380 [Helicobacter aurati]|uniref:Uncharacterized protein n=1 Tax=Helicobacter aurati TaxID=137778 RepID=A0A3D8J475_9HELI|nr:hypothetical protein CQA66_05380 [Helicobacter aurati]